MDGRLDDLMAALQLADQQAKIAGEKNNEYISFIDQ